MAIKAILLRKKIDDAKKRLQELNVDFTAREKELEQAIAEAETEEEKKAVEEAVDALEKEQKENADAKADLEAEVTKLEGELAEIEEEPAPAPAPAPVPEGTERKDEKVMIMRKFFGMNAEERSAFFADEKTKAFLGEIRQAIAEKRALTNVGLTIPDNFLGLIRQRVEETSKLLKYVHKVDLKGKGRVNVLGAIPEGIWLECCAALKELDLGFSNAEVDCWKVGGFFAVCNATLEDSDVALATELINALGQAIGKALDKAIIFGRNSATARKMPLGIFSRLAQTAEPDGYPATAREWEDLHATNIITIPATAEGAEFFQALIEAFGAASDEYATGDAVWCMNKKTRMKVVGKSLSINAAGAIVAGVQNQMPIVGGNIERLPFIPDNVIVAGYFEDYLLAERAGTKISQSEHAQFIQDNTLFKGTARYDGMPVIPEAFVVIGIEGTTPNATAVTFPTGE